VLRSLDTPAREALGSGQTAATQGVVEKGIINMKWQIETIINVANSLQQRGRSGASTGEQIAAAFVLNRSDYLPANYRDMVEAWEHLDQCWQYYVKLIKRDYMHLIEAG
jgi:hypothetical protein